MARIMHYLKSKTGFIQLGNNEIWHSHFGPSWPEVLGYIDVDANLISP